MRRSTSLHDHLKNRSLRGKVWYDTMDQPEKVSESVANDPFNAIHYEHGSFSETEDRFCHGCGRELSEEEPDNWFFCEMKNNGKSDTDKILVCEDCKQEEDAFLIL